MMFLKDAPPNSRVDDRFLAWRVLRRISVVWYGRSCYSLNLCKTCHFAFLRVSGTNNPLFKVALCPMTTDKCCMDIIENNQVDVRLAYFLQTDYDISVSLKAQSISAMDINLMPKTLDCEQTCTCTGIGVPHYT